MEEGSSCRSASHLVATGEAPRADTMAPTCPSGCDVGDYRSGVATPRAHAIARYGRG
jgi:hypothetical protein